MIEVAMIAGGVLVSGGLVALGLARWGAAAGQDASAWDWMEPGEGPARHD